jgi:hypothetical protein
MDYYVMINCANCDEEIYAGVNRTYLTHNELPVVSAAEGEQQSFECDSCGHTTVCGELDTYDEGGEDE